MKFIYDLSGLGWASGIIDLNGIEVEFDVSYSSDPIGSLLESLAEIHPLENITQGDSSELYWYGEPWGYRWQLKMLDDGPLNVVLHYFNDVNNKKDKGRTVIDAKCDFNDFTRLVLTTVGGVLNKYGFIGYFESWRYEFPIRSYLMLLQYHLEGKESEFTEYVSDAENEDIFSNTMATDIRADLRLLEIGLKGLPPSGETVETVPHHPTATTDPTDESVG